VASGDDTLRVLLPHVDQVTVPRGEFFFRQNDAGTNVFVLEQGRVSMRKSWQGRDLVLGELGPGDCFGEIALLEQRRNARSSCSMKRGADRSGEREPAGKPSSGSRTTP
jgi:CRP-like cAMP-binding protein